MSKHFRRTLWILGLIATFAIDVLIAMTTGFIGHAMFIELLYVLISVYIIIRNEGGGKWNMKYRKKPVVIEAIQYTGDNELEIKKFVGDDLIIEPQITNQGFIPKWVEIKIKTLEGDMTANIGDYIIKGVNGEFYPCKPNVFEKTYELVED